jgi:predicted TPR repeat methyltransferase
LYISFEHSLVDELQYNGFERLRRGFDRAFGGQDKVPRFRLVIDAGCGTGLVGEQFRNVSEYLVGVDLSEAILEEAIKTRPGLYNETRAADVMEVFREMRPISLIVAADSYIYFGDLASLFDSMQEGLEDGGFLAFTLENVGKETEET